MIYFLGLLVGFALPEVALAAEEAGKAAEGGASGIGALGLNGTLFLAQLINFAVIFFILWRWVFRPIAAHLTERTAKIEQSLRDAEDIEQQKAEFEVWRTSEMQKARNEAGEIMARAKADSSQMLGEAKQQAQNEYARILETGRQQLGQERDQVVLQLKAEMASLVTAGVEKVLEKKLTSADDQKLVSEALLAVQSSHKGS